MFNNSSLTVFCLIVNFLLFTLLKFLNADRDVCCFLSLLYIGYTLLYIQQELRKVRKS